MTIQANLPKGPFKAIYQEDRQCWAFHLTEPFIHPLSGLIVREAGLVTTLSSEWECIDLADGILSINTLADGILNILVDHDR